MGNILSFFFPQPDPPSIEQVEEVGEMKAEETIAKEIKDAVLIEDTKSADLVIERDTEHEKNVHTDEGFEVVEEATLSEIKNTQHDKVTDSERESNATNKNPVSPFIDETEFEGPCCDLTLEPNIDEVEIEMVENALKVESSSPCMYALTSNSPPAGVEEIGYFQDENVKLDYDYDMIKEPETVSTSEAPVVDEPEPVNRTIVESSMHIHDPIKSPSPDKEIIEEPEVCLEPGSKKSVLPESVKGQTPEPTEDLSKLVKVPCPEVEAIGSISDVKPKEVAMNSSFAPGSSFCGTMIPSKQMNDQLKEDIIITEVESQEVQPKKGVSGGVEGLKDVLTESNLQDFEVKEDSPVTEAPVKAASLDDELPNEVSGGIEGLKNRLTEPSKVQE